MRLPRVQFSVRRLLGGVALIATICGGIAWFARVVNEARRDARSAQCSGHLTQIALALHNYHEANGCFPPAYTTDRRGRPMHSWRVLILPFMEQAGLYNTYNFEEPWDGPNNSKLARSKPLGYACPNGQDYAGLSVRTNYVAIVGPGTAFPGSRPTSLHDFRDGAADTILVAEVADSGINWMEPRDLDAGAMSFVINDRTRPSISSHDPQGPHVACADGFRTVLNPALPPRSLKALITASGGEAISIDEGRLSP